MTVLNDVKELLANLNSKSDWAIVGAAGLLGFVMDAAINIAPLPIFTPGTCGLTAAGAALAAKRGWEARQEATKNAQLLSLYYYEADRLLAEFGKESPRVAEIDALRFDLRVALAASDLPGIRAVIERARDL